jgi:3-dehydroquinate dehydratase
MATFLKYDKPLICAMIQCPTPEECIAKIKRSISAGAEALGIQLCKIRREYRTEENLRPIFETCEGLPVYITSYRGGESKGYTDEECAELLCLGVKCGGTLADVMGDFFSTKPSYYELTEEEEAIKKQKTLIDKLHAMGAEILISSHTQKSLSLEENLNLARSQAERGADVMKIVNVAASPSEIPVYLDAIQKITSEHSGKRLLLLASGEAKLIRYIGANFGVCMYLCVESHGELDTKEQPTIAKIKAIRDNIIF